MREIPADEIETAPRRRFNPWRLWPLVLLVAGLMAFVASGAHAYVSFDMLRAHRQTLLAWKAEQEAMVAVVYVALYCAAVAFSIPGGIWLTIAGGFLFGAYVGTLYAVIAATMGAALVFIAARYALGDVLRARAGSALDRMEAGFRANALSYLLFLRLVPVFPFWLVNLVPAFLGVRLGTFVVGTLLGIVPGTFVYATVGGGLGAVIDAGDTPDLGVIFQPAVLGPIAGLALLALLPVAVKRWRGGGS